MTNSSESTGTFRRKLASADASNIVPVLDMMTLNGQYAQFEADFILGFAGMLESLQVSVGLFNLKAADFPAITPLMSEAEKQAELARIRTDGQKIGLSLWIAKGNGPWEYVSECVLQNNANSESYVPLLVPFLTMNEVLLIDRDFRLGVKVETKWQGPLKNTDYLVISGSWRQRVTFTAKKNELEIVLADIEALKLAIYGKLIDLPASSMLGSVAGGVASVIPLPLATNLGGTGSAGALGSFGSTDIKGKKSTWAGIGFPDAYGAPIFMQNDSSFFNGMWSNSSSHPAKWLWWYQDGQFRVFGNSVSQGSYIAIDKGFGSLPGYPADRYPTLKTDFNGALYFSVDGNYSAHVTANGTYVAVSDYSKKENIRELDYQDTLERIKYLPVCEYSFKGSDSRIKSISTFAQAFWLAFGLGGDVEVLEEDSPTQPNKMMATSDMAGVCLAGVKGLIERVELLEAQNNA